MRRAPTRRMLSSRAGSCGLEETSKRTWGGNLPPHVHVLDSLLLLGDAMGLDVVVPLAVGLRLRRLPLACLGLVDGLLLGDAMRLDVVVRTFLQVLALIHGASSRSVRPPEAA